MTQPQPTANCNIAEALAREIARCSVVMSKNPSSIGGRIIDKNLERAYKAIGQGDCIEIVEVYNILRRTQ